jgi:hypothetical protein
MTNDQKLKALEAIEHVMAGGSQEDVEINLGTDDAPDWQAINYPIDVNEIRVRGGLLPNKIQNETGGKHNA